MSAFEEREEAIFVSMTQAVTSRISDVVLRATLAVLVGLALVACTTTPRRCDTQFAAGVYTLVTVDGRELPATVKHGDDFVEVRSGLLKIGIDGTCQSTTVFAPPTGRAVSREVRADCVVEGERWTMRWKGAGTTSGTLEGATFTMNNEGLQFVYRK